MPLPDCRIGILGPGRIAAAFAEAIPHATGCRLQSVASRDPVRAAAFARQHEAVTAHSSYEALAADPEVDLIYIATPHRFHAEQIRLCLEADKAVLCEKPITTSAAELAPLIALASEKGLFLMEGLWSRCLPAWLQARSWIKEGRIGPARFASADFGFRAAWNPADRLLNPDLAGGALWDVGIYTLAFATWMLGTELQQVHAAVRRGGTGVDEDSALLLRFATGAAAQLTCSIQTATPQAARVEGPNGSITLRHPFWKSNEVYVDDGKADESMVFAEEVPGFTHEIRHVRDCLRQGRSESPLVPLAESLLWQQIIDQALARTTG